MTKMKPMKSTKHRSTVGCGTNMTTRVEKQRRGTGSYSRKTKYGKRWED